MLKKLFSFWIDEDLKTSLVKLAKKEDVTMAKFLNRLIRSALNKK